MWEWGRPPEEGDARWYETKGMHDLRQAYAIAVREAPAAIYRETGYAISEFLKDILPALLDLCMVQATSTAIGAGVGGLIGSLAGGVGAAPGAVYGAGVGFSVGATILTWLGLAFLFIAVKQNIGEVIVLVQLAVKQAWHASEHPISRSAQVQQAGFTLARAMGRLMLLILQAIVAWLFKRGAGNASELYADLRKSKLGDGFTTWVEQNIERLRNDARLQPRQVEGSTAKATAEAKALTPSQLVGKVKEEAPTSSPKVQTSSFLKPKLPKAVLEPGATPGPVAPTINAMPGIPEGFPPITQADVNTFSSTPTPEVLPAGAKLYRIVGDSSNPAGAFWTREMPATEAEWRSAAAVKGEWNGDGGYVEYTVPEGGISAWTGQAAPQPAALPGYVLKGGGDQVVIPAGSMTPSAPKPTPWNAQ